MIWKEKGESNWLIAELDLKTWRPFKSCIVNDPLEYLGW